MNIAVLEPGRSRNHIHDVASIAGMVAPGATVTKHTDVGWNSSLTADHDVVNHSYGYIIPAVRYAVNVDNIAAWHVMSTERAYSQASNALHVHAAGNSGFVTWGDYDVEGGRATADTITGIKWLYDAGVDTSRTIFVGSLSTADEITHNARGSSDLSYYSVSAGERAKNDFIVAKGANPHQRWGAGTSYAAPRVSGAAALVMHKFETNAVNTKKIILETADGLGSCRGVAKRISCADNQYGHGKLNVGAALSPVGKLR